MARAALRSPFARRSGTSFEVWADEYVRNESKAESTAGRLRRLIVNGIRALPEPAGRVLHASYAGWRAGGKDVENLLFNDIDQMLTLFSAPGRQGVRFEDLGPTARSAPDGTSWPSFYSYRLAEPGGAFHTVEPGRLVCRVPEVTVPDGPARPAARIWIAVRRARPPHGPGGPLHEGEYLLRIAVRGMNPAEVLKAAVDGASAAIQRDDPDRVSEQVARLSALLGVDPEELLALVTAADAPLGTKSRPSRRSKESLFKLDKLDPAQVYVTPDDHRCAAAQVVAVRGDGPPCLSVEVYSAARRLLTGRSGP